MRVYTSFLQNVFREHREDAMGELSLIKSRVLIVDDCETNRAMLVEILKDDYEIIEASGGERAL